MNQDIGWSWSRANPDQDQDDTQMGDADADSNVAADGDDDGQIGGIDNRLAEDFGDDMYNVDMSGVPSPSGGGGFMQDDTYDTRFDGAHTGSRSPYDGEAGPQLLISTVRSTWSAAWHLMMSQLAPSDPTGRYTRPTSQFRSNSQITLQNKPGALHLYVGLPCPWAHRTLVVRALKGLETAVPVSVASPGVDGSWEFRDRATPDGDRVVPGLDSANGCKTVREVYKLRRGGYNGRSTVPMLWDVERKEVVCNESYDIIELFNSGLNGLASNPDLDLSPPPLKRKIEEWNQIIYPNVNNGVYRCGFAQSQEAYDSAVNELFSTLDMVDDHLGDSRYLCGDVLTLADVCLFTTLIRFDLVYNVLFKCTKRKLIEYPNLHAYMRDIYQIPKVAATCNFGAIMDGYYKILFPLNPSSILPVMPSGCEHEFLSQPHNRTSLSLVDKNVQVPIL